MNTTAGVSNIMQLLIITEILPLPNDWSVSVPAWCSSQLSFESRLVAITKKLYPQGIGRLTSLSSYLMQELLMETSVYFKKSM